MQGTASAWPGSARHGPARAAPCRAVAAIMAGLGDLQISGVLLF